MEVPLGTTGTANAAVESWNVDSAAATVVVVVATEEMVVILSVVVLQALEP